MTTTLTLARLHDLRLSGMAQALTQQQEQSSTYEALPFLERLGLLVEQECLVRDQRTVQDIRTGSSARRGFKLRLPHNGPGLSITSTRATCKNPATADCPPGPGRLVATGTKPAHYRPLRQWQNLNLACALGHNACLHGYTTRYYRLQRRRACCLQGIAVTQAKASQDGSYPQTAGSRRACTG